ncbi:MAG: hydroxymethylglutaryl-CoA lyase [Clostridia bacterium]|nr:hydroxymethylglutaryl-CoA lyase [Deltaproteobacteria bacterium]
MAAVIEVGPRDGLQNEARTIPTDVKVAFVDALTAAGIIDIEVSAFVAQPKIPQLSDAEEVFQRIQRRPGLITSALVPNMHGYERAIQASVDKIAVFTAASETFNGKNINTTIAGAFDRFVPVLEAARREGKLIRGYISTAFWCPYEGRIAPGIAINVARKLLDLGVDELSIGDTIGKASPDEVRALIEPLLEHVPPERVALHFHDTFGNARLNVLAGLGLGILRYDSSAGGIGGCPYAPGARGNIATEVLIRTLRGAGVNVEGDLTGIDEARAMIAPYIGHPLNAA